MTAGEYSGTIGIGDAYRIGLDAYTLTFPLVLSELTRRRMTGGQVPQSNGRRPENRLGISATPGGDLVDWPRPDFGVLTAQLWIDVNREPLALLVPEIEGRFFQMRISSMWTDLVASLGSRHTGSRWRILIVPSTWPGAETEGVHVVRLPTNRGRLLASVKLERDRGADDAEAVRRWYEQWRVGPLSRLEATTVSAVARPADPGENDPSPLSAIRGMSAAEYFTLATELLHENEPSASDRHIVRDMLWIGIGPNESFRWATLAGPVKRGLIYASLTALNEIELGTLPGRTLNRWTLLNPTSRDYTERAVAAFHGFYPCTEQHELVAYTATDRRGQTLTGLHRYRVRIPAHGEPPTDCSWTLALFDREGRPVSNALGRYALEATKLRRSPNDGSFEIAVQHQPPLPEEDVNWIPAPLGLFNLQLRLYWPRPDAQVGRWAPPIVERVT